MAFLLSYIPFSITPKTVALLYLISTVNSTIRTSIINYLSLGIAKSLSGIVSTSTSIIARKLF